MGEISAFGQIVYYIVIDPAASKKCWLMQGYVVAPMCLGTQGRDGTSLEPVKRIVFSSLQMLGNSAYHERPFDAMLKYSNRRSEDYPNAITS